MRQRRGTFTSPARAGRRQAAPHATKPGGGAQQAYHVSIGRHRAQSQPHNRMWCARQTRCAPMNCRRNIWQCCTGLQAVPPQKAEVAEVHLQGPASVPGLALVVEQRSPHPGAIIPVQDNWHFTGSCSSLEMLIACLWPGGPKAESPTCHFATPRCATRHYDQTRGRTTNGLARLDVRCHSRSTHVVCVRARVVCGRCAGRPLGAPHHAAVARRARSTLRRRTMCVTGLFRDPIVVVGVRRVT